MSAQFEKDGTESLDPQLLIAKVDGDINSAAVHEKCVGLKKYSWKGDKSNKAVTLVLDNKVDTLLCTSLSTENVLKTQNNKNVFSTENKEDKNNRREESIITEYCVRSIIVRIRRKRRKI